MITKKAAQADAKFLDMQAEVGVTKHIGGFEATNELLSLCHVEDAREVLNVGCGIGVGSTTIAKKYDCHVVGVDISEKMIDRRMSDVNPTEQGSAGSYCGCRE